MDIRKTVYTESRKCGSDCQAVVLEIKVCKDCNISKDIKEFSFSNKEKVLRRGVCKKCVRRKALDKGWISKEKQAEAQKKWVKNNKEEHFFRKLASRHLGSGTKEKASLLRDMFNRQGRKCAYTDKALVIGKNCSIDHIKPQSKYPELSKDICNLEFVDIHVNYSKREMEKEDFIQMCKTISRNYIK